MPQRAVQSLATGVSVMKRMSGLCVEMREMMSVFDGLCLPVFLRVLSDNSKVVLCACIFVYILVDVMLCGGLGVGILVCFEW